MHDETASVCQPATDGPVGVGSVGRASPTVAARDAAAPPQPAPRADSPPASPGFQRISTRDVPPDSRLDYWQSLFPPARMEYPRGMERHGFHGELVGTAPWQDLAFLRLGNSALTCRFGGRDPDSIVLLRIHSGTVYAQHGRDSVTPVTASTGLMLFDQDQPIVSTSLHPVTVTGLKLPRALVREALGAQPIVHARDAVRPLLHPGALLHGLLQHLEAMAASASDLAPAIGADAMATARSLVMTLLARHNARRRALSEAFDEALLASARYQIDLHAGNPELTAGHVAAMLGCSRAHLYRLFAREGDALAGALRETRLQRARRLLALGRTIAPRIGDIAWQCGYSDFSAFDKAFRRRFGVTPTDFRHDAPSHAPEPARAQGSGPLARK